MPGSEHTDQLLTGAPLPNDQNQYNLLMQAPVAIAVYRGPAYVIEMANERMLELWDKTHAEVWNKPVFEAMPGLKDQGFENLMDQVLTSGESLVIQEIPVLINRKGRTEKLFIKVSYEPLREKGVVNGVMVMAHDITEQVLGRQRLEESEERFRDMIMRSSIAITILEGPEFRFEIINESYLDIVDRKREDAIQRPMAEVLPEIRSQGVVELLQQVYDTGESYTANEAPYELFRNGRFEKRYFNFVYRRMADTREGTVRIMVTAADVTDMVESKFAIQQSEKEFANVYMESPMGMAILRGETFVVEKANHVMLSRFWGKTIDQVQGRSLTEIFPELKGQKYPELLRKVYITGKRHRENESPVTIYSGEIVHHFFIDFEYLPLTDTDKKITGVMVTAYDVTERVKAKQLIEEAEQRSRLAIEATDMGTFDWDLRTQEFTYSDRLAAIFGAKDRTTFSHHDLINLIHPDDLPVRHAAVKNAWSVGSLKYSVRLIWPDKSLHWVSVYGKIAYDESGKPVRMYGTAIDISRERQYQKSIEESELKFRSLASFLPTFIWTTDPLGRLTYFNQAILDFSGLTEDEMQHGGWFQLLHPEDRANSMRKLEKAISSGSDFQAELRFKNSDGVYRWQLGRSVAIKNDAGEIQSWIGTSIDIHDQKLMSEELERRVNSRTAELKKANEELLRTNQDLEQFAYVSSHDLQEPLRKIQTFSDLVLKKIGTGHEEMRIHLEKINSSANRMSVLITDLLNYSRVSKSDENFVAINLNRVLDNILSDFEVLIRQKDALIKADGLPIIRGIPIQINQLFYNLVSNALKFSVKMPVITITATDVPGNALPEHIVLPQDKNYCVICFKDNGIGFEQVYATQIFTIFQRLNNRVQYSGTGIGLAICKKIAENHGGYIEASSVVGEGAEFTVYLAR